MPLQCKFRALFPDFHPEMRGGERGSARATSFLHRLRYIMQLLTLHWPIKQDLHWHLPLLCPFSPRSGSIYYLCYLPGKTKKISWIFFFSPASCSSSAS